MASFKLALYKSTAYRVWCRTRGSRTGVWQRIFEALAQDADNESCMIDSKIVRAHQHNAGAKKEP